MCAFPKSKTTLWWVRDHLWSIPITGKSSVRSLKCHKTCFFISLDEHQSVTGSTVIDSTPPEIWWFSHLIFLKALQMTSVAPITGKMLGRWQRLFICWDVFQLVRWSQQRLGRPFSDVWWLDKSLRCHLIMSTCFGYPKHHFLASIVGENPNVVVFSPD